MLRHLIGLGLAISLTAAILFGGDVFACRQRRHLAYESQRKAPHFRALRKAQGIHERLGGTGCTDDPVFKPKGRHWRTFSRLMQRFQETESRAVPPWFCAPNVPSRNFGPHTFVLHRHFGARSFPSRFCSLLLAKI